MLNNIVLSGMAWASSLKDAIATRIREEERGQDLIEYAVLAGAIAVVAAVALFALNPFGNSLTDFKNRMASCISFNATVAGKQCAP